MDPKVMEALAEIDVPFRSAEPLSRHTTMGVGGPAAVMAFPRSPEELRKTLRLRAELDLPHRILGSGSNLIVADQGLDELVVNTRKLKAVAIGENGEVRAEAGANLIRTALRCCRAGWRNLEWSVGIPGTVGGAVVMNAGAFGATVSEIIGAVSVFDQNGDPSEPPEGWHFHYRGSSIPEGSAVAGARLRLKPGDPEAMARETRELMRQRVKSQPGGRNAGCVFKNPPSVPAGKVIDDLGLKGTRRGAVVVSERHANFLVNQGGARADDVLELLDYVREMVARKAGIELELEVKVWRPRS